MVRPAAFGYNTQTAATNVFQHAQTIAKSTVLETFDKAVATLKGAGLQVFVMNDQPIPPKPDAIFPNNWFALHHDGTLALFPMAAPNRRLERSPEIVAFLENHFHITKKIDLTAAETEGHFLEGTGSIVFDHPSKTAFACYSERTDAALLAAYCEEIGYKVFGFDATDSSGMAIYHTNVVMAIGAQWAVVCLDAITNQRAQLEAQLQACGKTLVPITHAQMQQFCGNVIELRNKMGQPLLVLSEQANAAFTPLQKNVLAQFATLVPIDVEVIETIGGGGIRCMIAELFAPMRNNF